MKNSKSGEVRHGVTCIKAEHQSKGGYLHDADDDTPFDVDGVLYCGRCHAWLDSMATARRNQGRPPEVLKPCPFCGESLDINAPGVFQTSDGGKWGAVTCCCTGPEVRTHGEPLERWRDAAIAAWNKRDGDSAMGSVIESIRKLIAEASNE